MDAQRVPRWGGRDAAITSPKRRLLDHLPRSRRGSPWQRRERRRDAAINLPERLQPGRPVALSEHVNGMQQGLCHSTSRSPQAFAMPSARFQVGRTQRSAARAPPSSRPSWLGPLARVRTRRPRTRASGVGGSRLNALTLLDNNNWHGGCSRQRSNTDPGRRAHAAADASIDNNIINFVLDVAQRVRPSRHKLLLGAG